MDMGGDSGGDSNQGGDSGDGEDSNDDDSSDGMPKDAPQTTGALTAGGDSDNDDDDDNESGGRDNDEDNNNDNEPTSEDAPVTTDTVTTQKKECPKGQEVALFSTSCVPSKEPSPAEQSGLWSDSPGGTALHNYDLVSSKKNPDGSTTGIFQHKNPDGYDDIERIEKTVFRDGTIKVIEDEGGGLTTETTTFRDGTKKVIMGDTNGSTRTTTTKEGSIEVTIKDKDNNLLSTSISSKGSSVEVKYSGGKPSSVVRYAGGHLLEEKNIAPDDSFTKTTSYEPGSRQPTKIVTDYREPPRKVTETFDGNTRKVIDYNPQDGWTTTKSTEQRTGSTTTEITKTNPDGSISTKNPDDNTITTNNKDGTWFMTFPASQDGSVKTYHSDGRTTIEKPK
jgi:hypothetical protein